LALALLTAAAYADEGAPPVAAVESGLLRGTVSADAHAFLGVPYAAPPVGRSGTVHRRRSPPGPASAPRPPTLHLARRSLLAW